MKQTVIDVLATVGIIVLFAVAVVMLIVLFFGCADRAMRGFLEHPKDGGVCLLKIKNETPFTAELRSGHLLWRLRDGLMPHTAGTLPVETGKRYILTRRLDVNGVGAEAPYEFYIAKGKKEYTVIFGGLQTGVLYNRSGRVVKVFQPQDNVVLVLRSGAFAKISVMPGQPKIVVFFGEQWRWRVEGTLNDPDIDDIRADNYFDGEWVDWVKYIDPSNLDEAKEVWP